jgi:alanyl-tRNA synthetase
MQFEAEVMECRPAEGSTSMVVLTESCFYPTGGGQLHDVGTLGGHRVVDVTAEAGVILHRVDAEIAWDLGMRVTGCVDAERRAHHRQQHTGQHILSRALELELNLPTVSARLGATGNTIDLSTESISDVELARLQQAANEVVWATKDVRVQLSSPAQAEDASLRAKAERAGSENVRVVEVDGFDRCPCGGTHVRNTGEVGLIAITRREPIARGLRLHFLCGARALNYLCERDALLTQMGLRFSSGVEELLDKFERMDAAAKTTKKALADAQTREMELLADAWLAKAANLEVDGQALRWVGCALPADAGPRAGAVASRLAKSSDLLAVILVAGDERSQLLISKGADVSLDCGAELRRCLDAVGGKGGGRADAARGSYPSESETKLRELLRDRFGGSID